MKKYSFLPKLNRRRFIKNSVIVVSTTALPLALTGCNETNEDLEKFVPEGNFGFSHGVASFDPSQDKILLWTRYLPAQNETNPMVLLDVATDMDFNQIVASESILVQSDHDYTIIVDVTNLNSNTKYYYRFRNEQTNVVSVIGETKTLPNNGEVAEIKMAAVACANFQAGLFNVYGAVAESDVDVVLHLGDYIYENEAGGYGANENTSTLNRLHEPTQEVISIEDYRTRYRQYRSDPQLQKAHQLKPFICVWDDHEVANDAYKDGAQNHQQNEGSYESRKQNAIQVWHEYLPARVDDKNRIYREFSFGEIASLYMLDTRIIGRDKQLKYQNYFTGNDFDQAGFDQDWQDPNRTILGSEQFSWLTSKIASSNSSWQILGSQVLMGKYFVPAELLSLTSEISTIDDATSELLTEYGSLVADLISIKTRLDQNDPTLTEEEIERVTNVLPYNLDAWDGYPAEREAVLAAAADKKLLSIAGDTHNAWHAYLTDIQGVKVGAEFATASITSPGFDSIFKSNPFFISGIEQANVALIDDLLYNDASRRGFVEVSISAAEAKAEWKFVGTLTSEDTSISIGNTATEV